MVETKQIQAQYKKMTETPIPKLITTLSIPTIVSMLVTNIYNMADTYFVGTLGTSASAATGVVFGLMAILQAFGFMFGHGAGSNIARKLGNHDISAAKDYAFYILIAGAAMTSGCVMNNILRYEGKAFYAMIGLTSGGFLNIFGDYLFVTKFHMGISGAGLSTAISQYISMVILLLPYLQHKTQSSFHIKDISKQPQIYQDIISCGLPSLLRQGLNSLSTMVLNGTAGFYGDAAVAALSIVTRIVNFLFCIALGIGQGFQPVSSFNYGAHKYKRVKAGLLFSLKLGTALMICLSVFSFINAKPFIAIFRNDPKVIAIGQKALRWSSISLILMPITMYGNMLFQSVGKASIASFLAALRSGLALIPTILIMHAIFGLSGLEKAPSISEVISAYISLPFMIQFVKNLPKEK